MTSARDAVDATSIARCEQLIRPHVRRTPVVEIDAADVGLEAGRLCLKLELLQHSGSFKARGAFANLLTREVPAAGWSLPLAATTAQPSPTRP
jgi:threonine dehydratase